MKTVMIGAVVHAYTLTLDMSSRVAAVRAWRRLQLRSRCTLQAMARDESVTLTKVPPLTSAQRRKLAR